VAEKTLDTSPSAVQSAAHADTAEPAMTETALSGTTSGTTQAPNPRLAYTTCTAVAMPTLVPSQQD